MARRKADAAILEDRLGYPFKDRTLLTCALTHVSAAGGTVGRSKNYQRLEFLGDRVLGLAVAEMLFNAFPKASEGELSQRLSELVRRDTCAEIALAWDVGPYLKLGGGDMQSGGRTSRPILADVCESIIGAVFLDGGYDAARKAVLAAFGPLIDRLDPDRPAKDAKTRLQEILQARHRRLPLYRVVAVQGEAHRQSFEVECSVAELNLSATGTGTSRQRAEQQAAKALLEKLEA
jgi:ribonuclease-3